MSSLRRSSRSASRLHASSSVPELDGCVEQTSKKYTSRASPPFPANECRGRMMTTESGEYESVANSRGIYTWRKKSGASSSSSLKKTKPQSRAASAKKNATVAPSRSSTAKKVAKPSKKSAIEEMEELFTPSELAALIRIKREYVRKLDAFEQGADKNGLTGARGVAVCGAYPWKGPGGVCNAASKQWQMRRAPEDPFEALFEESE